MLLKLLKYHLAEGDLETSGVAINVVIDPIIERSIDVPFEDIRLIGEDENYEYSLSQDDVDTVSVIVSGAKSIVDAMTEDDLKVSADVDDFNAGDYTVLLSVQTDAQVTVKDYQHAAIQIRNK